MKPSTGKEYDKESLRPLILHYCGQEQCKPSHYFGPAIRPHYLIHYVLHGQGSYYVNKTVYHIKGGEGFLIYPGVTTIYCADEKDPWEYCWIGFDGYDVPFILHSCGMSMSNPVFSNQGNDGLWDDIQELIHSFKERKENEFTYLSQLYRCFSRIYLKDTLSSEYTQESHIDKALDFIHNNYSYEINILDIAKFLNIDRTYLYKLFMANVNLSPQQYLIHYRLETSRKLLTDTALSVTEIAYSCGFRDSSAYNKHFKKHYGMTPLQFRTQEIPIDD